MQYRQIEDWQVAYVARELRKEKKVMVNCLKNEANYLLEQLGTFSNSSPLLTKSSMKPNSNEIYVEIVDVI